MLMNNFAKIFNIDGYQVLVHIDDLDEEGESIVSVRARSDSGIMGCLSFTPNVSTSVEELFNKVATEKIAKSALSQFLPLFESCDGDDINE